MNKKFSFTIVNLTLILILIATSVSAAPYDISFGGVGPAADTLDLATSISGFPVVTSQWNQPRSTGTNPHQGIDIRAQTPTDVNAVCDGWVTSQNATSTYHLILKCDTNGDGLNNDNLKIYYDHLSAVGFITSSTTKITEGTKVALSGNENGGTSYHLHFGTRTSRSGTMVWTRNEPYYRWTSNWNYGRDLDFISLVTWTNNIAKVVSYEVASGIKKSLNSNSVTLFHRKDGTASWSSVQMTKSGDEFSYNLGSLYTTGEIINWMVRSQNPYTSGYNYAFMIPKYEQPTTQ
ncbi:M23 family metallopeptidase [Paenibacillus sp. LHD-38]|uniref:M23 family metallopeptidase n=1 Tax=Paenibacillus sp. LHD-38 TaxID=3072143 RepID=UPI0028101EEA|nr:M23 family metallopeptidase [Paenibacillus sp. LHD-38]MDQ8737150.1 M23 family metallopeptidase [Paenibacillus sp. LHD-38]